MAQPDQDPKAPPQGAQDDAPRAVGPNASGGEHNPPQPEQCIGGQRTRAGSNYGDFRGNHAPDDAQPSKYQTGGRDLASQGSEFGGYGNSGGSPSSTPGNNPSSEAIENTSGKPHGDAEVSASGKKK